MVTKHTAGKGGYNRPDKKPKKKKETTKLPTIYLNKENPNGTTTKPENMGKVEPATEKPTAQSSGTPRAEEPQSKVGDMQQRKMELGEPVDFIQGGGVITPVYERVNEQGGTERFSLNTGGEEVSVEEAEQAGALGQQAYNIFLGAISSLKLPAAEATAGNQQTIDAMAKRIMKGEEGVQDALIKYTSAIEGKGIRVGANVEKMLKSGKMSVKSTKRFLAVLGITEMGASQLYQWFAVDNWLGGNSIYIRDTIEAVKWDGLDKNVAIKLIEAKIEENMRIRTFSNINTIINPTLLFLFRPVIMGGVDSQVETMNQRLEELKGGTQDGE